MSRNQGDDRALDMGCHSKGHRSTGVPATGVIPAALHPAPAAKESEFLEKEAGGRPLGVRQSTSVSHMQTHTQGGFPQRISVPPPENAKRPPRREPASEQRSPGR